MKLSIKGFFLFVLISTFNVPTLFAELPSKDELYEICEEISESLNYSEDVSLTISIIDEKANKPKTAYQYKLFRRDRSKQITLLQIAPELDKGMGYLQDGDNFWTYDPNTRQFSHYSIKQTIGDSNVKISDVNKTRSFRENYEIIAASEALLGKIPVYKLELKPLYKDAEYAKEVYYISIKDKLILKIESFAASGRLMRTTLMAKYVSHGKNRIPIHQISINNIIPGEKSTLIMSDFSVDKIPDMVFTKAYLEKVN